MSEDTNNSTSSNDIDLNYSSNNKQKFYHELDTGDIIIRRARNGWIMLALNDDEDMVVRSVFTDNVDNVKDEDDSAVSFYVNNHLDTIMASSFLDLLWEGYPYLFQSKRSAGLNAEIKNTGWEAEEDDKINNNE